MPRAPRTRMLIVVAVGVLVLDAALLAGAGYWTGRPWLMAAGAGLALLAVGVMASWRLHLRRLSEIDTARADLAAEARELGRITRKRQ